MQRAPRFSAERPGSRAAGPMATPACGIGQAEVVGRFSACARGIPEGADVLPQDADDGSGALTGRSGARPTAADVPKEQLAGWSRPDEQEEDRRAEE